MNKNKSQLTLYLQKKQTPKNLVLIINDGVSKLGWSLASSVVASVPLVAFTALRPFRRVRQLRQLRYAFSPLRALRWMEAPL